jgi:hypothetical protein
MNMNMNGGGDLIMRRHKKNWLVAKFCTNKNVFYLSLQTSLDLLIQMFKICTKRMKRLMLSL